MSEMTFDGVRKIGLALPDVTEGTAFGKRALKVGGQMFACEPSHKSAEPDSLVVRIDNEQRGALLAEAPDTSYLTDHYVGYPSVLVRLARIRADEMRDLLRGAHRFVTTRKPRK
jgi:hypothetical protein